MFNKEHEGITLIITQASIFVRSILHVMSHAVRVYDNQRKKEIPWELHVMVKMPCIPGHKRYIT